MPNKKTTFQFQMDKLNEQSNWVIELTSSSESEIRMGVQIADEEAKRLTAKIHESAPITIEESIMSSIFNHSFK